MSDPEITRQALSLETAGAMRPTACSVAIYRRPVPVAAHADLQLHADIRLRADFGWRLNMHSLYLDGPVSVSAVLLTRTVKIAHQRTSKVSESSPELSQDCRGTVFPDGSFGAISHTSGVSNFEHKHEQN